MLSAVLLLAAVVAAPVQLKLLIGTDAGGHAVNAPADWPAAAGAWNAKTAVYNRATRRIAFYALRNDIVGGSIRPAPGAIRAAGVKEYFQAGPATGAFDRSGTTEVYVSNADGSEAVCWTCDDVVDGQNGVAIWRTRPSTTAVANSAMRQTGARIYANQNKDLTTWYPDGSWLVMAIEMPRHALMHDFGLSEKGEFNDLWAVSANRKTWVQLTDFASTWPLADAVAGMPFACADTPNCAAGCQYAGAVAAPFDAYWCSARGAAPVASGTMRPRMSGTGRLVWGESVGLSASYALGSVLQLAGADVVLSAGLPALVNSERNVTPTPSSPHATNLWSNPGGATAIGTIYEPWGFSPDDASVQLATDAFFSTANPAIAYGPSTSSAAFMDVTLWSSAMFSDVTRRDAAYFYDLNAAPAPFNAYGHWEEPAVVFDFAGKRYIAFASSANLVPPFDPAHFAATFGLDIWLMPLDRIAPAERRTFFNSGTARSNVYPTTWNPDMALLYVTATVNGAGTNPPGNIYALSFAPSRRRAVRR